MTGIAKLIEQIEALADHLDPAAEYAEEAAMLREAATALETLQRERDSALEAEDEAKDCFWAVYPTYIEARGRGISTEAARTQIVRERDEAVSSAAASRANFLTMQNAANELRKERDEAAGRIIVLEAALFPFAAFADTVDQFVTDRARDDGSPIMPTKHFRLAHFKAARAALTKGE